MYRNAKMELDWEGRENLSFGAISAIANYWNNVEDVECVPSAFVVCSLPDDAYIEDFIKVIKDCGYETILITEKTTWLIDFLDACSPYAVATGRIVKVIDHWYHASKKELVNALELKIL